jgi:hypothetical protein
MKQMAKLYRNIVGWATFGALSFSSMIGTAFAQGGAGTVAPTLVNPLGANCNNLTCPLTAVANFLFVIAIPLCGIIILIGGFQMMTAAGDPEKFSKGKKTLLYAVIGFAVILIAGSVATLIKNAFGGS